jgi:hypothetical protein
MNIKNHTMTIRGREELGSLKVEGKIIRGMKKKNPIRKGQNPFNKRKYRSKRGRQNKCHSRKKKTA